ncbi:sigma-70 family RNA polymerase sigma factor [Lutibacter sp. B2]|nr:sigma-70 family RNA polymerase sigma factor [Lutibacter sp. B2]
MNDRMKDLVDRCKVDKDAKADILERLRPLVISSIKKYSFGNEGFEDLLQEGYWKILSSFEEFDEEKGVPYLGYIKLQLKFLYLNRNKKDKIHLSLDYESEDGGCLLDSIKADVDIEDNFVFRDDIRRLLIEIDHLSYRQRKIIFMNCINRMSMVDAANELGISYKTAMRSKKAALDLLRQKVK